MNRLSTNGYTSSGSSEGQLTPPANVPITPPIDSYTTNKDTSPRFYSSEDGCGSSVFDSPLSSPAGSVNVISPCGSHYSSYSTSYSPQNSFIPIDPIDPIIEQEMISSYMPPQQQQDFNLDDIESVILQPICPQPNDYQLDIEQIPDSVFLPQQAAVQSTNDFEYETPEVMNMMQSTSSWSIPSTAFL